MFNCYIDKCCIPDYGTKKCVENNQKQAVQSKRQDKRDSYVSSVQQTVEQRLLIVLLYTFRSLLKATLILLPLLGLTWVFGLLTVDQNSSVFAWIFTLLNSAQVCIINYLLDYSVQPSYDIKS